MASCTPCAMAPKMPQLPDPGFGPPEPMMISGSALFAPPSPVSAAAASRVGAPAGTTDAGTAATSSREGATVNVYPQPGQSEETIGNIAADKLDWLEKVNSG